MTTTSTEDILEQARHLKNAYLLSVKNGTHAQFFFDSKEEQVKCKCGCKAVWWKTAYLCGSITAYPCKY